MARFCDSIYCSNFTSLSTSASSPLSMRHFDGKSLVANYGSGKIDKIDASSASLTSTTTVGTKRRGLTFDG